uniref:HECT domain-containing protein n=1 Tax=Amphiprion ocellaris TaxID=80972 RepID=A0A3Q1CBN6_AMPOC
MDLVSVFQKITTIEDLEKAKAPLLDYLANAGCLRPLRSIRDRDLLVQDVMFQVIHRNFNHQPTQTTFREGLKTLGVLEKIQKHPDSFRPLFSKVDSVLICCPSIGFSPSPSVEFIHKGDDDFSSTPLFPMASTCVNCIRLPLHASYQLFKEKFDFAIGNTYGFGRA